MEYVVIALGILAFGAYVIHLIAKPRESANKTEREETNIPPEIIYTPAKTTHNETNTGNSSTNLDRSTQIAEIPENVQFDNKGLPYKIDKKYEPGWGKQFNAFVTASGEYYHKSKCRCCKSRKHECIHVYTALKKGYKPCKICKPKPAIDDWYIEYLKSHSK